MLRALALSLLPIALFVAACGGSGSPSEPSGAGSGPPALESDAPASTLDGDVEGGGSEALNAVFAGFDPFSLLSGLDPAAGFENASQEVDPGLTDALLDEGDLPEEFKLSLEDSLSNCCGAPLEERLEMAARLFATGDLESADPGTVVWSLAGTIHPEALEEFGNIEERVGELERQYYDELGLDEVAGFELLDGSSLGDGGYGMRIELDHLGFGQEFYVFFRDSRMLATMVMWPLDSNPNVDAGALAETMDAKAAALE